jgi:hypothetical protein
MCHEWQIALLGIQSKIAAVDWDLVIFNGLTIKGIYGREMYETWYKMTTMIQSGLDISPIITHRFPYLEFEHAFQLMKKRSVGKDHPTLERFNGGLVASVSRKRQPESPLSEEPTVTVFRYQLHHSPLSL